MSQPDTQRKARQEPQSAQRLRPLILAVTILIQTRPKESQSVSSISRRTSVAVDKERGKDGDNKPSVVPSMTNTDTVDVEGTALQCEQLARAGSELVRVTVNTKQAAAAVPEIVARLSDNGVTVPVIGDFHYNGHILLKEYPDCAKAL